MVAPFFMHITKTLISTNRPHVLEGIVAHPAMKSAVIVGICRLSGASVLEHVAQSSPHLLIILAEALDEDVRAVVTFIRKEVRDILVVELSIDQDDQLVPGWDQQLRDTLKMERPLYFIHPPHDGQRLVFHDEAFDNLTIREKLRTPSSAHFDLHLEQEESRFKYLLFGAKGYHLQAQKYFDSLTTNLDGLNCEISYRTVHGSYKALSWARDLVAREAAVLAHYLPRPELECFPRPTGMHAKLDFVHHKLPPEGELVVINLVQFGVHQTLAEMFLRVIRTQFTGQTNGVLFRESALMFGLANFMRQVVIAHLEIMNMLLNAQSNFFELIELKRDLHRKLQIWRDFWAFEHVLANPVQFLWTVKTVMGSKKPKLAVKSPPILFTDILANRANEGRHL